ncbi:MAG: ABC transporter ATP-binding protein [Planctomycetes bacterium]|nr:ABC transporter ATP-binding protein [Planctomycetota bacterium]
MIRNLFHLLGYCKPYWRPYLIGTVALFFTDILDTFTPQIVRWTIDHLEAMSRDGGDLAAAASVPTLRFLPSHWFGDHGFMHGMWVYFVLYVLAVALTGVCRYFFSLYYSRAAVDLTHNLRGKFFGHVQKLSARYHDKVKAGDLMTLATADTNAAREFFWVGVLIGLDTLFYFTMVPIYMADISWRLLLVSLCTLPLIPFIVSRLANRIEMRYEDVQDQLGIVAEKARESFAGAKVIKSFAQEENEIKTFARMASLYKTKALSLARIQALQQPLLVLMLALADMVVVIYGGSLVLQGMDMREKMAAAGASSVEIAAAIRDSGAITVGGFVAFFSYLIRLSGPMVGLGWVISLYQRAHISVQRIEEVLDAKVEITDAEKPAPVEKLGGGIEIRNLTFRFYPDAKPALADVSITVQPGKTLAIVGPVGSGKTSLLNLIPRLYDPPAGSVFLDGVDVREIKLDVLRTQIGAVPQETFLFSETILQNLALGPGGDNPDPQWLKQCAKIAQVDPDIVAFPKQYETMLGEKGVNLSGGQKQRVAIARAIARKPAILLLDDCLSAVDTQTEEAILAGLKEVMKECTTLIVSHRISTVEHADEIVVLNDGRVVERGTHSELLDKGGYYAELHKKQQLEAELSAS